MLLKVQNLSKYFYIKEHFYLPKKIITAFENISFDLELGEKLKLNGANGSGKTTLVKTIAMLNDFDRGDIVFNGKSLKNISFSEKKEIRNDIILIMQNQKSCLNPHKNIKWHFDLIVRNFNKQINYDMFFDFNLDMQILDKYPSQISGGQAQIIGLLRGLMVNPKLLILDEIDAGLDASALNKCVQVLKSYNNSIIFISHQDIDVFFDKTYSL